MRNFAYSLSNTIHDHIMKKIAVSVASALLLTACGNTQIEHCTNEYDPVAKGNVDSLNAQKGEVISEIPDAGIAEQVLDEAKKEQEEADTTATVQPSDIDESGEVILPEEGGEVSISEQAELEEIEDINRRTSEEARRQAEERQRRALEEMGN